MVMQRTLMYSVAATGNALHSGDRVCMRVYPADADTGVVFRRVDVDPAVEIPARVGYVSGTESCTAISKDGVEVCTIEHLLSAFAGYGIDNACVELDGGELPAMDGSASAFVLLIKSAGIQELPKSKQFMKLKKEVRVSDGDKYALLSPTAENSFSITCSIEFDDEFNKKHPLSATHDFSSNSFLQDIARARTFGFSKDIDTMRSHGLALGASPGNAIEVRTDGSVANVEGLRSREELVKHKILDTYGDISLLGHGLLGHLESYKSGHALNNKLLNALLANEDAWDIVQFSRDEDLQIHYDYFPVAVD